MPKSLRKQVEENLKSEFKKYIKDVEKTFKNSVPVASANLRDSVSTEQQGDFKSLVGVDKDKLVNDSRNISGYDYSWVVLKGINHPVVIRPKQPGGVLRWEDGSGVHYAKYVTLPPRPPNDFIAKTIKNLPKFGG